jgi:catechol 2,3-dioxygenase-like lactoylglutathione lyase family enzyme
MDGKGACMIPFLGDVEIVTLFVEDLRRSRTFYVDALGLETAYEDDASVVVRLGNVLVNLLVASEAPTLVQPLVVGHREQGTRMMLTFRVDDADASCEELRRRGISLLNGPISRPWGRRTAAFADPDGNVWELAQVLRS